MSTEIEFFIEGGDDLVRAIRNRFNEDKVARVVKRNTSQAQKTAMRLARVKTGTMRRSITMSVDVTGLAGYLTAGADYSIYHEFGTRKIEAKPFMRPAAREQAPIFISDLKNLIRKG